MKNPTAVVISDVHYSLSTLEVADAAMNQAIDKSNALGVNLIVCGDLHDTKANLRGECVWAMLKTFSRAERLCFILRGNHDQINEKSEEHSLEFLRSLRTVIIIDAPVRRSPGCFIPYQCDPSAFEAIIARAPKDVTVFMHQGVKNANPGHYNRDHSAISKDVLAGRRVISGHYHTRQSIDLPNGGKLDYVGNPYTLTFNEHRDPEKGFQVLYDDGSLEFIPTDLRKHRIIEIDLNSSVGTHTLYRGDILWVKAKGTGPQLALATKDLLAKMLGITQDFRLEYIPTEAAPSELVEARSTQGEALDQLIDSWQNVDDDRKARLKDLWKQLA